jgi:integrase/recombinase XerC
LAYERTARSFLSFLGKRGDYPQPNDVERFLARPLVSGRPRSAATRNHELASIRALADYLRKQGAWQNNPTNDIPFAKESRKDPTFLMRRELARLFESASTDKNSTRRARNLAIVALLSQLGLRVHELVALNTSQVDVPSCTLLSVCGKGDTRVDLPMSRELAHIVSSWVSERAAWVAPGQPALFITNKTGGRISIRSVQRLITALWAKCNSAKTITPHSLRHTTATLSITLGTDISAVGDLLRHSSLDITRRYIGLVGARRRAAVEKLAVTIPRDVIPTRPDPSRSVDRWEIPWVDCYQEILDPPQNSIDVQESLHEAAARRSSRPETLKSLQLRLFPTESPSRDWPYAA